MTQLCEDLQRRGEVEALSRARIQPMCDGVQLVLGVARQIRPLGQVLPQQAIGVLIGAALPGLRGSAKNTRIASRWARRACSAISLPRSWVSVLRNGAGRCRSFRVNPSRALPASVPSMRVRMTRRVVRSTRVPTAEPWACPLDEVAFPVAGHSAGGHVCGALGNGASCWRWGCSLPGRFCMVPEDTKGVG